MVDGILNVYFMAIISEMILKLIVYFLHAQGFGSWQCPQYMNKDETAMNVPKLCSVCTCMRNHVRMCQTIKNGSACGRVGGAMIKGTEIPQRVFTAAIY